GASAEQLRESEHDEESSRLFRSVDVRVDRVSGGHLEVHDTEPDAESYAISRAGKPCRARPRESSVEGHDRCDGGEVHLAEGHIERASEELVLLLRRTLPWRGPERLQLLASLRGALAELLG